MRVRLIFHPEERRLDSDQLPGVHHQLICVPSLADDSDDGARQDLDFALRRYAPKDRDHLSEHKAIMEAALRRDADLTVELMRKHLKRTVDALLAAGVDNDGAKPRARAIARARTAR
jgi:hypothetical protein